MVNRLELPRPFGVDVLCQRISEQRGRPIHLVPMEMPVSVSGLWVVTAEADVIMYEQHTSRIHQQHIILHEIGHLLSQHDAAPTSCEDTARLLLPYLSPGVAERMLCRTRYTAPEEQEAELIASELLKRAGRWRPSRTWSPAPGAAGIARRLERSLEQYRDLE